jgi:NAD(P)H-flavin reductase
VNTFIPRRYRIIRCRRENRYTTTLRMQPVEGEAPLSPSLPGQFNMVYLFGVGEVAISVSRAEPELEHTVAAVGSVTVPLCKLKEGELVGLRGPYGNPWPVDAAAGSDLILMAGGLGLAPLRPVIHQVLARRESFGRVWLLYGARSPSEQLFKSELRRWRSRFDFDFLATVDRAEPSWRSDVGLVTELLRQVDRRLQPERTVAFVCGPELMMRSSLKELSTRGLDSSRIYLSSERNMKCGMGVCGHCQYGPLFLCRDGPVVSLSQVESYLKVREL